VPMNVQAVLSAYGKNIKINRFLIALFVYFPRMLQNVKLRK
jgi:hypothetical protein